MKNFSSHLSFYDVLGNGTFLKKWGDRETILSYNTEKGIDIHS